MGEMLPRQRKTTSNSLAILAGADIGLAQLDGTILRSPCRD